METRTDEPILPRLLASNALRANLEKHMTLNQMADTKASMIMTAASLVLTITITQMQQLDLMTVLILLVLATLLLQLAWFNRHQLVLLPELKPYVERACRQVDCRLKPNVDLENIELLSRDVRSHPTHRNALLITATFINRATFEQPYPDVGLVLSDLGGNVIAQRQFNPVEYLKTDLKPADMMLKEVPVTLVMEVQDPGSESISFRFEFL